MHFLADESCDFAVVRALRDAGHDVLTVAEAAQCADDDTVLKLALQERRILLTEDKDFGQLVYASQQASGGVVLIRYPAPQRGSLAQSVVQLVNSRGDDLVGRFVVVMPGRARFGRKAEG